MKNAIKPSPKLLDQLQTEMIEWAKNAILLGSGKVLDLRIELTFTNGTSLSYSRDLMMEDLEEEYEH